MTIESAKDFYRKMSGDAAFRAPFESASSKEEKQQLIKDTGYEFTADEWQQATQEIQAADSSEELNEEELEAIAGGFGGVGMIAMYGVITPQDISGWLRK